MARSVLDIDDLSASQLRRILSLAARLKCQPAPPLLDGRCVAALFEKPSSRTRVSFEVAVVSLGGHCVVLRSEEVDLGRREATGDVARVLSAYCVAIGARVHQHSALLEMARAASVPVVNLLSDRAHPLQAIADLLTLEERLGGLEGRRVAFVGDGNNVASSLALAGALCGLDVVVASPPGYELDESVVERARNLGGTLELAADPTEAVSGADAIYTDTWVSMGSEDETEARQRAFAPYRVDGRLLAAARPGAIFLHCLPAHRGEEVTAEVLDGPASAVWQQAENRLHAAKALLVELLGEKA